VAMSPNNNQWSLGVATSQKNTHFVLFNISLPSETQSVD